MSTTHIQPAGNSAYNYNASVALYVHISMRWPVQIPRTLMHTQGAAPCITLIGVQHLKLYRGAASTQLHRQRMIKQLLLVPVAQAVEAQACSSCCCCGKWSLCYQLMPGCCLPAPQICALSSSSTSSGNLPSLLCCLD